MRRLLTYTTKLALSVIIISITSCLKQPAEPANIGGQIDPKGIFDFSTTKLYPIEVDLNLSDYSILVEVYGQNPITVQTLTTDGATYYSEVKTEGIEPIFKAITDTQGKFSEMMDIPTNMSMVYLYTEYPGVPHVIAVPVTEQGVSYVLNAKSKLAAKSSPVKISHNYPNNMLVMGDWDNIGIPDYIASERAIHPSGLMNDINYAIPYTPTGNLSKLWKYLDNPNIDNNLNVKVKTPINLIFADESASMDNSFGYYHYPTDTPPSSPADIQIILAYPNMSFPNLSSADSRGLSSGDQVHLKYWNKDTEAFEDQFPANTTIGFVMLSNSFKKKDASVSPQHSFYTNSKFNTTEAEKYRQHSILFYNTQSNAFVYSFEDIPRTASVTELHPGGDFRDAVLYIQSGVANAISTDNIADMPEAPSNIPDQANNTLVYNGTLLFEDLWPYEGDYDMNDIVIRYNCTQHRDDKNMIIKLVDKFTVLHNGGKIACGFGYQLSILTNVIKSITTTPALESSSIIKTDAKGMEYGQTLATTVLFDNIQNVVGQTHTVITELTTPQNGANLIPPYNAFAIISTNLGRGSELHLPNQKPTTLANTIQFGTGFDISNPQQGLYYISKNRDYPFAIRIPGDTFDAPNERVRIDIAYPDFKEWVESKGAKKQSWYIK